MTFRRFISIHTYNFRQWAKRTAHNIVRPFVKICNKLKERWHLFKWAFRKGLNTGEREYDVKRWLIIKAVFCSIHEVRAVTFYVDTSRKGGVM